MFFEITDHHFCAFFGKRNRHSPANPTITTSNQSYPALQFAAAALGSFFGNWLLLHLGFMTGTLVQLLRRLIGRTTLRLLCHRPSSSSQNCSAHVARRSVTFITGRLLGGFA